MTEIVYIPFPRELYADLVRLSDGRINPADLAESQLSLWLEVTGPLSIPEWFHDRFGERIFEFAEKYSPTLLEELDREYLQSRSPRKPLVWKEITVSEGSDVRMSYGGEWHYAKVCNGKIVDADGAFSPSEWAYKTANRTSRNAWRDLWFKDPGAATWVPAQLLREQARDALRGGSLSTPGAEG